MLSIVQVVILIVVVGLVMWLVNEYIPMPEPFKKILNVFVVVALVLVMILWLLRMGGLAATLACVI